MRRLAAACSAASACEEWASSSSNTPLADDSMSALSLPALLLLERHEGAVAEQGEGGEHVCRDGERRARDDSVMLSSDAARSVGDCERTNEIETSNSEPYRLYSKLQC